MLILSFFTTLIHSRKPSEPSQQRIERDSVVSYPESWGYRFSWLTHSYIWIFDGRSRWKRFTL